MCDRLAEHVSRLYGENRETARLLIQIKRDLFNERLPASAQWERVAPHLPPECCAEVDALMSSLRELAELTAASAGHYATELDAAFDASVRLAGAEQNLVQALALTNPQVHARLLELLSGRRLSRKARAQLCTSLGRYILRAGQKTSPLSSFGLVALGGWHDAPSPSSGDGERWTMATAVERRLQPRYAVLDYVCFELLGDLARIDDAAPVALNTSLRSENGEHVWARIKHDDAPESRTRGTRVAKNRSRAVLAALLRRIFETCEPGGTLTLRDVREALCQAVRGDAARANDLLATAWTHALILPALPPGADPVAGVRAACACLVEPLRDAVSSALEDFVAAIARLDRFDPGYMTAIEHRFEQLLLSAGLSIPVARFRPILFEDCTLPAPAFGLPRTFLRRHEPELVALLRALPILTSNTPLTLFRRLVVRRFRERYGAGGLCTDVLDFVDTCADEFERLFSMRDGGLDGGRSGSGSGGTGASADAGASAGEEKAFAFAELRSHDQARGLEQVRRDLFTELARRADTARDVVLTVADLERHTRAIERSGPPPDTSKMFFVQPVDGPDGQWLAVNHVYPGASCTFSRFIPDDAESTAKVRSYLCEISEDGRFVELGGIFGFNANRHAALSDDVINIPPFPPVAATARSLDSMRLRHRADRDDLVFEDDLGPVNIFFLGILTPLLMPRTYQVVRTLCFSAERMEDIGDQLTYFLTPDADGAITMPRVRLGRLVLARRSLAIRKADLPDPGLEELAFFEHFTAWADRYDLPRWLFSRRTVLPALHRGTGVRMPDWRSLPGKDAKPMPLDRECPLAVRIFQKNLAVSELDVLFAEALPDPTRSCFQRGEHAVVGEFGIELTLKERA